MDGDICLTPSDDHPNSHSFMSIPLREIVLIFLWRQINLQFWKQKLGCIMLSSLLTTASWAGLCRLFREMSDITPKRTAFLDRPCDNALFKICHLGSFNATQCLGSVCPQTPIDQAESWEVKLHLLPRAPGDHDFPVDVLEVYGATDSVCKAMGFDVVTPQRSKWPWQGMRSWGDIRADFEEDSQPKTEPGVSIFPKENRESQSGQVDS